MTDARRRATTIEWMRGHRRLVAAGVVGVTAAAVLAVVWFQPHRLLIDRRVDETLPGLTVAAPDSAPEPSVVSEPEGRPRRHPVRRPPPTSPAEV